MLDAWSDMPWWARLIIALVIMGVGVVLLMAGFFRGGSALIGLGFILFIIGGKTRGEKSGYRF
jgi:membrane-bound ClpP family serine protease